MADYLLDSNHLMAAILKVSVVRDRIQRARTNGDRFVTCIPALCELEAGIVRAGKVADLRRWLNRVLKFTRLWPLDRETTRTYGEMYVELRNAGRVLSAVDMMLASLARQRSLTILTTDRDFEALPDIKTENWVT